MDELTQKLNRETAKISWRELQRFFAAGRAVYVSEDSDLIAMAKLFAADDASAIKAKMDTSDIGLIDDETAADWYNNDVTVWALVVSPWVLVQRVSVK